MTREELIQEVRSRLEERLVVEEPKPYGSGILVTEDGEGRVLVLQRLGQPNFVVTVHGQADAR